MTKRLDPFSIFILTGLLGLAVMLGVPAAASAAAPGIGMTSGGANGFTTATFFAYVDPQLQTTSWSFEWDLQSSKWCTSGGTSGSPANSTATTPLGEDAFAEQVFVNLTDLTRFTTYCGRFIATNADGEGDGTLVTWQQDPPVLDTLDAFSTSAVSATVDISVNPEGNDTVYDVEYGLASSAWCTSDGVSGPVPNISDNKDLGFTDDNTHDVPVELDEVQTGAEYCARAAAVSPGGEAFATTFVTFTMDKPGATTGTASPTGGSTATVTGNINPNGETTTYQVQYDLSSSAWCTSGGTSGSPAGTTNPATLGFADELFHGVSVDLTALTAASDYCARLIATNVNGEVDGLQVSWTQGVAPDALTFDTYSTGANTATVEGLVNPHDEDTTYAADYGVASSEWCTSGGTSGSPLNTTAGTDPIPNDGFVSVDLTELTNGMDYCAQLVATDANGDAEGGQVPWTQGAPFVDTFDAEPTGLTTATIDGDVNPAGQATSYVLRYDLAGSEWCSTDGASGTPANTTASHNLPDTNPTFHDVTINLSGLTSGADYCGEIVATNGTASTPIDDGEQVFWIQPTPPPTLTVTLPGAGTGVVTSSPAGIDCGAGATKCSASFDQGTQVTLTATPSTGSTVGIWISAPGCSTPGVTTCKVTVNGNTTIGVVFGGRTTHTLTVVNQHAALGGVTSSPTTLENITCGAICSASFNAGTQITLTATAFTGNVFTGWSGGGCSGTGTCIVTLNADTTVTASFKPASTSTSPTPPPATKCVVPKVTGKTLSAARKAIASHHCGVGKVTKVKSSKKHEGKVISQSPKPGKHLKKGSKVALKVGK
jgi:hypothetical protein